MDGQWWSVEVLDGEFPARSWHDAHRRDLVRAAIGYGAVDWNWSQFSWGVIFEVCFPDDDLTGARFEAFRDFPAVRAALDAVPAAQLLVYRGRGGSAGARVPRKPKPAPIAAAAAAPEPDPVEQRTVIDTTIETSMQL
jgi:hypothetical protein